MPMGESGKREYGVIPSPGPKDLFLLRELEFDLKVVISIKKRSLWETYGDEIGRKLSRLRWQ